MELNNIRLLVNKFDECFEFYGNKLGLKITWGEVGADYASFDIGMPSGLSLFKSDLMSQAVGNANLPFPSEVRDRAAIIIKVESVDETYKLLCQKEVAFLGSPVDMTGWGIRVVHLRDPEGNLLEFFSELPKENWDKDLLDDEKKFSE